MKGVFDDHGYYLTGDIAKREGSNYFILGRDSQDGLCPHLHERRTPQHRRKMGQV